MAKSTLAKKLLIKPGQRIVVINSPPGYFDELGDLPEGVRITDKPRGEFDFVQVFAKNVQELNRLAPGALRALRSNGNLWVSFPKGSSKTQANLTRDSGWEKLREAGFEGVSLISVNEVWSAMRFRASNQVGKK